MSPKANMASGTTKILIPFEKTIGWNRLKFGRVIWATFFL